MSKSFIKKIHSKLQIKTLTPFFFMGSCCREEIMHSCYELRNEGLTLDQPTYNPSLADILIISGPINHEQLELLMGVFQKMSQPKWVMALGTCSLSGGGYHSGIVSRDISEILAIDVKVEGCPPSTEVLKKAFENLLTIIHEGSEC